MIRDDRILALAYQSADIFISPSLEDSGPMMVNEAMMCGTPVVAFNIGIAKEFITSDIGYLAKWNDAVDLSRGIEHLLLLNKTDRSNMRAHCSEIAKKNFSTEVQIDAVNQLLSSN